MNSRFSFIGFLVNLWGGYQGNCVVPVPQKGYSWKGLLDGGMLCALGEGGSTWLQGNGHADAGWFGLRCHEVFRVEFQLDKRPFEGSVEGRKTLVVEPFRVRVEAGSAALRRGVSVVYLRHRNPRLNLLKVLY